MEFNENFTIARKTKNLILQIDPLLENIPKKDLFSRDTIKETTITLLESIYHANLIKRDKERKLYYQEQSIVKLRLLDFHIERLYKLKYISGKKVINISNSIKELNKMIYGWIKSAV